MLKQKPAAHPEQTPLPVLGRTGWEVMAGMHGGLVSDPALPATLLPDAACPPGCHGETLAPPRALRGRWYVPFGSLNLSLKNARELMGQESEKQNM